MFGSKTSLFIAAVFVIFAALVSAGSPVMSRVGVHVDNAGLAQRSEPILSDDGLAETLCDLVDVICPQEAEAATLPTDKKGILMSVCNKHGLGGQCWRDLYAMHLKETSGYCNQTGKAGEWGCFQINPRWFDIPKKCAFDLECSADFTIANLIKNGYPKYRTYAISKHNGSGVKAKRYAESVKFIAAGVHK